MDSSVAESCSSEEALCCIHVGLLCVQDNPDARPFMSNVVSVLESRSTALPTPDQPFYFAQRKKATENRDYIQDSVDRKTLTVIDGR